MTKRHYLTSFGIFIAATFFIKHTFDLLWSEAVMTIILAIVCVIHSIDVMRDIDRRKKEKHRDDGGSERPIQGPEDPTLLE